MLGSVGGNILKVAYQGSITTSGISCVLDLIVSLSWHDCRFEICLSGYCLNTKFTCFDYNIIFLTIASSNENKYTKSTLSCIAIAIVCIIGAS